MNWSPQQERARIAVAKWMRDPSRQVLYLAGQGSQWPSVFVVDESTRLGGEPKRWLYTAVTRAANHVAVLA